MWNIQCPSDNFFILYILVDILCIRNFGAVTTKVEIFKGRDLTPPSVAQLRIEIPAITLRVEHDKKISVAVIVSIVFEIARMLFKQILEQVNEMLVEEYCGKKYERGKEFRRHSKKRRTISTLLGEVTLNLTRIRGKKTIIPLYDVVEFERKRKYQSDIKAISVDSALRMSGSVQIRVEQFHTGTGCRGM